MVRAQRDAHCNEKVAFLVRTEVRCTMDAAVSVQSRRCYALSSNGSKCGQLLAWVTLSRLAPGSERPYGVVRLLHH